MSAVFGTVKNNLYEFILRFGGNRMWLWLAAQTQVNELKIDTLINAFCHITFSIFFSIITSLSKGDPLAFLPIVGFTLTSFSPPFAEQLVEAGLELTGKTDLRFVDTLYKVTLTWSVLCFQGSTTCCPCLFFLHMIHHYFHPVPLVCVGSTRHLPL